MQYSAVIPVDGELRRIFFDAADVDDARRTAIACNAGLEGEARRSEPARIAYSLQEARELLGGVSRATVYNWVALGRLERVPNTRRLLVTRQSLERAARAA
jgi:hypothetical protein